jgi:NNP family nitrate/nitrite transporter-like MFS transporter
MVVLLTAVLAFIANSAAWSLIRPAGPGLWQYIDVSPYQMVALLSVPILIGSLGRIPAGVLSDRYGAGRVLPVICVFAAGAVIAVAAAGSFPAAVAAACALGVAGTAFPVGAALVMSAYPPGRRGLVLSGYGVGVVGVAITNLAWLREGDGDLSVLLVLAAVLAGCAVLVVVVTRGQRPARRAPGSAPRTVGHFLRLPATRQLSVWYAAAFGGALALGLYLPAYLRVVYDLDWHSALLMAAVSMAVAGAMRPVGGWLADRRDPTNVLTVSYAAAAALAVMLAFRLPLEITIATSAALAACLGLAGGVVLALIGNTAPAGRAGTIIGVVGAVGGLAGILPSLLLAATYERTAANGMGWPLLAGVALALAMYLRGQRGWTGAALAFAVPPTGPVTTVVSVAAADADRNDEGVLATLAALAGGGDLVIVYGYRDMPPLEMTPHALVARLRAWLPRHVIVTIYVNAYTWPDERELIAEVLDDGGIILICTPTADIDLIASRLSDHLGAAQLLHLTDASIEGFRLSLPWPVATR